MSDFIQTLQIIYAIRKKEIVLSISICVIKQKGTKKVKLQLCFYSVISPHPICPLKTIKTSNNTKGIRFANRKLHST